MTHTHYRQRASAAIRPAINPPAARSAALPGLLAFAAGLALTAAVLLCGLALNAGAAGAAHGRCFPAKIWDAPDKYRPCAHIQRVLEDGSVVLAVTDHDGTVRFSAEVGAQDR